MIQQISDKSKQAFKSSGFLTVYEGAVRSAKTFTSLLQWYKYVLMSPEKTFLMSGNTLGSISRNCLYGDFGFIAITGNKAKPKTDTDGSKHLQLKDKRIYYCGADNKASFKKIRGLTIGGWYADEINLHDRDFIETALARSFASTDRQNIWTLNPDRPGHFIYTDYIDKYRDAQIPGYNYFHFTMEDNPAITPERLNEIRAQYTGVFYQRYVLGLRVAAEGACYPSFTDANIIDKLPEERILFSVLGSDIGGNKSATAFALVGYYLKDKKMHAVLIDEIYDIENKNTDTILSKWRTFASNVKNKYNCYDCYTDSAEQLILKSMRDAGIMNVHNSLKKPVIDRIRFLDMAFANKRFYVMKHCTKTIDAIRSAVYDSKSQEEKRLDDGTTNIDSLDAMEYALEKHMGDFI